ncbi:ribosome-associated translation inhibitor RaiA [Corallococcus sp. ZKHCc1 1396]|uniref:Ribosome hibernation promoting factor n=1 Tax=Corallococcus soli TaxID=2710757 RepID=A0ABR9PHK4_9BACT|nr:MULTISPECIES: ribosome-associated translation inhibitor RaiA [Corallococcus]MBE4747405.1 ribosome-associated translation inhibitor RaiA [Corallococcus soli]MCY1036320.1 ribosome-associated translation inhibitor RaiA [Corallococcus sp. BB11-1]
MQLNITFRQFGASDSLKEYAREKVDRVNRLLDRAGEAHVVLSLERHLHHADITIHSGAWILRGREKSDDMYASIDLAMDKIERQLRRYRDKLKSHHGKEKVHHRLDLVNSLKVRHDVFEVSESLESTEPAEASPPSAAGTSNDTAQAAESGIARLVRTTHLAIQSLSVDDAVMQMNLMNNDFYVFQNQQSQALSIVYRRKEGGFGLIEPHLPSEPVAATGT